MLAPCPPGCWLTASFSCSDNCAANVRGTGPVEQTAGTNCMLCVVEFFELEFFLDLYALLLPSRSPWDPLLLHTWSPWGPFPPLVAPIPPRLVSMPPHLVSMGTLIAPLLPPPHHTWSPWGPLLHPYSPHLVSMASGCISWPSSAYHHLIIVHPLSSPPDIRYPTCCKVICCRVW